MTPNHPANTRLSRRPPVSGLGVLCSLLGVFSALACQPEPERVILVSIDTLRADHVGAYGAEAAHTPIMDALAAEGVRFANVTSPAPLTLPSHTTLMTGMDPPEHGVRHNGIFALTEGIPTLAESFRAEGYQTAAFVGAFVLAKQFGLARGFDHYDDRTGRAQSGMRTGGFAERPANEVVNAVLEWLETAGDRFFIWVHFYDPHAEYRAPHGFAVSLPHPYAAEIAFTDSQLGRLLTEVNERWPADDAGRTLVAVTSDHGEALGQHGEETHSHFVYEATQRVPLILHGGGVPVGAVVDSLVSLSDVAPTLLSAVRAAPLPGASGVDLLPIARGDLDQTGRATYMEALAPQLDWGFSPLLALRTDRYKFIRAPRPELYDLLADPREKTNLYDSQTNDAEALDAILTARLQHASPMVPNVSVDDDERRRLESLGYIVPEPETLGARGTLGAVGGTDPKDGLALVQAVNRADRLVATARGTDALALLRQHDGTESLIYLTSRAAAALAAGELADAEWSARGAIAHEPRRVTPHARLVEALIRQGRLHDAREALETLVSLDPEGGQNLVLLGIMAESEGDVDTALAYFERAMRAGHPDASASWRHAALSLEKKTDGDGDARLTALSQGQRSGVDAVLRIARAERRIGRHAAALERVDEAIALHPSSYALRAARVSLLADIGRSVEARAEGGVLLDALRAHGSDPAVSMPWRLELARARLALLAGSREEAALSLDRAQLHPATGLHGAAEAAELRRQLLEMSDE